MENETTFLEPLFEKAEAYGKTSYDLFKLKATEKTINVLSVFFSRSISILSIYTFVIFVSLGISLWLGDLLGKLYYGFLCVAGFYGIMACVLFFFMHNQIKKWAGNLLVKQML